MLHKKLGSLLNKVPEVTAYFWIIKVLGTTVGETAADFLNINLNLGLTGTSIATGVLLLIALIFQLKSQKYIPSLYWSTVVLISVFGTLVTDNLTDAFGVSLEASTIFFSLALATTFAFWYKKEKTLSIHSIVTRKREIFYWLAILFTFALGTAAGDLMAEGLGLGYMMTGIIIASLIAIVSAAWKFGLNSILGFWIVYILTRPLGASLGDLLSQPSKYGGLGLGATTTSVLFILAIIIMVVFLSVTRKDVTTEEKIKEEEKAVTKPNRSVLQLVVTLFIVVSLSGFGYHWRQSIIKNSAKEIIPVERTTSSDLINNTRISALGDLSLFKTITQDTLDLVKKGDLLGAKTRIADIEYEWDKAESRLKPIDKASWTQVDDAIDAVLRQLRAVKPNSDKCESSLNDLLVLL